MPDSHRNGGTLDAERSRALVPCKTSMPKGPPWWRSCRYLLAALQFWGMAILFFHRNHFSIAIVCMVNHTAVDIQRHALTDASQGVENGRDLLGDTAVKTNLSSNSTLSCDDVAEERKEDGPYVWSRNVQGMLLGAMFWTYMALQLPGAVLAQRYLTVKTSTTAAIANVSIVHLFIPLLADFSPWAVLVARLVGGLSVAIFMVATFQFWSKWGPPEERTRLMAIVNSGSELGSVCVFPLSALLCRTPLGWPAIFYTFSAVGLAWCLLSMVLVYESPDVHPRISPEERDYIVSAIGSTTRKQRKDPTPWLKIISTVPLWAVTFGLFSFNWVAFQISATLPLFMREVLKFDIESNGQLSMLPYLASWAVINLSGLLSDFLTERRILSVICARKLIQFTGHVTAALCLVLVSFLDCRHQMAAVALLTLSVGLSAVCLTTLPVNVYDMAPKYFSVAYSFANTLAVSPGFLAPLVITALTKEKTREQWQATFFITASIMVAGSLAFLVLGRGTPLDWAKGEDVETVVDAPPDGQTPSDEAEQLVDRDAEQREERL